jgi:hypothetical protein
MLGWHVYITRIADGGTLPAKVDAPQGILIAHWETGLEGLRWFDELVKSNKAIDLGGNGYPSRYTAQSRFLLPRILAGPPDARPGALVTADSRETPLGDGATFIESLRIRSVKDEEWLLVDAWDLS